TGKEIGPFEATYLEGDGDAKGIDTPFVFDTAGLDDDAEVGDLDTGIHRGILAKIIMIMRSCIEDPGDPGDAELGCGRTVIMYIGQGKLERVADAPITRGLRRGSMKPGLGFGCRFLRMGG